MSTKEILEAKLQSMDEKQLADLLRIVEKMASEKTRDVSPSFMAKLKQVTIEAPEDFASNLDEYVNGEKRVA